MNIRLTRAELIDTLETLAEAARDHNDLVEVILDGLKNAEDDLKHQRAVVASIGRQLEKAVERSMQAQKELHEFARSVEATVDASGKWTISPNISRQLANS